MPWCGYVVYWWAGGDRRWDLARRYIGRCRLSLVIVNAGRKRVVCLIWNFQQCMGMMCESCYSRDVRE